jgi:hypothetical protein
MDMENTGTITTITSPIVRIIVIVTIKNKITGKIISADTTTTVS